MATADVFRWLPPQAQCEHCARVVASVVQSRDNLSVSLFCGGLAGCLSAVRSRSGVTLADLVAAITPDDDTAIGPALDLAEERGLDVPGAWPVVEREWPRIERHEHRWLPWETGDEDRAIGEPPDGPWPGTVRRCTCGVFEHEERRCHRCDLTRHEHLLARGRDCGEFVPACHDRNCQREAEDPTTYAGAVGYG
jgi:hypothetical protein